MRAPVILRWTDDGLVPSAGAELRGAIAVADSWRVDDGSTLALELHRTRFLSTAGEIAASDDVGEFWDAAIAAIPEKGSWFPRVEVRRTSTGGGESATDDDVVLIVRLREAPERLSSVTLATHGGPDPRIDPAIKGPSLDVLEALRADARADGVDDLVILDELGHVVEGAATALAWWRGDILCLPALELERCDSVTARAMVALATATGVRVSWETTAPEELDGLEVWALNALHGPRIVTRWIDGPATAEQPGRLATWRARLSALRVPLPTPIGRPAR
jgi:branched-subunit amino acid aminotransferase/4-amino-4-deoxychorismate lyase